MFAAKRSPTPTQSSKVSNAAREKVISKLLTNVVARMASLGAHASIDQIDAVRRVLAERVAAKHNVTDKEVNEIASLFASGKAPITSQHSAPQTTSTSQDEQARAMALALAKIQAEQPRGHAPEDHPHLTEANLESLGSIPRSHAISPLLESTTRRQRQQMADSEFSAAAELDRKNHIEGRRQERRDKIAKLAGQRAFLDQQIGEHKAAAEVERQNQLRIQREVTQAIEDHRRLTREERMAEHNRALREKNFREDQAREQEHQRQLQREREHEEQMRMAKQAADDLERERQEDLAHRNQQRTEWKKTLDENQAKLEWKSHEKERQRAIDRAFQQEYADRLDKQDRDRMDAMARKAARQAYFNKLASNVASTVMKKENDYSQKIHDEYQEQVRREVADESARKQALRNRNIDCQTTRLRQMAEKKRLQEEERAEAKRNAERMRLAAEYAAAEEEARKQAAKAEAARLKEFLNTQLQLQHYRETRQPDVSITRPLTGAKNMYTQSLFSQSPARDASL